MRVKTVGYTLDSMGEVVARSRGAALDGRVVMGG